MSDAPYDRAAVLENLGGDSDLLAEIAGIFISDWPGNVARLRAALAAGDATALRSAAHSVKGAVGNFAATRAVDAARALEYAGRDGDLAAASQLLEAAVAAVDEVVAALEADIRR
jgi:HPt (histidine-containing phosphotransfer) domain-containing protein